MGSEMCISDRYTTVRVPTCTPSCMFERVYHRTCASAWFVGCVLMRALSGMWSIACAAARVWMLASSCACQHVCVKVAVFKGREKRGTYRLQAVTCVNARAVRRLSTRTSTGVIQRVCRHVRVNACAVGVWRTCVIRRVSSGVCQRVRRQACVGACVGRVSTRVPAGVC